MTTMLIDRIGAVVLHNGIVRIDCISAGPDNQDRPAGTLLIPANQTGPVLQAPINAMQELDKKIREVAAAQQAAAAQKTPATDGA